MLSAMGSGRSIEGEDLPSDAKSGVVARSRRRGSARLKERQDQPLPFNKLRANGQFQSRISLQYLGQLYAFLPLWPDPHHTGVTLQRCQGLSHISPINFLLD